MTSIAIADDHTLFRQSFAAYIRETCKFDVYITAADGKDLLQKMKLIRSLPQIIISDIKMPVMDGRALTMEITKLYPEIKLIGLSSIQHTDTITDLLICGAKGFITKNIEPSLLIEAVKTVMEDHYFIFNGHTECSYPSLKDYLSKLKNQVHLTEKEKEFLRYCSCDIPYKKIADIMKISSRTIDTYRDHLFDKLDINSRTGLAMYAVNNGLSWVE